VIAGTKVQAALMTGATFVAGGIELSALWKGLREHDYGPENR
jgi:hypothetical protein